MQRKTRKNETEIIFIIFSCFELGSLPLPQSQSLSLCIYRIAGFVKPNWNETKRRDRLMYPKQREETGQRDRARESASDTSAERERESEQCGRVAKWESANGAPLSRCATSGIEMAGSVNLSARARNELGIHSQTKRLSVRVWERACVCVCETEMAITVCRQEQQQQRGYT